MQLNQVYKLENKLCVDQKESTLDKNKLTYYDDPNYKKSLVNSDKCIMSQLQLHWVIASEGQKIEKWMMCNGVSCETCVNVLSRSISPILQSQ